MDFRCISQELVADQSSAQCSSLLPWVLRAIIGLWVKIRYLDQSAMIPLVPNRILCKAAVLYWRPVQESSKAAGLNRRSLQKKEVCSDSNQRALPLKMLGANEMWCQKIMKRPALTRRASIFEQSAAEKNHLLCYWQTIHILIWNFRQEDLS